MRQLERLLGGLITMSDRAIKKIARPDAASASHVSVITWRTKHPICVFAISIFDASLTPMSARKLYV